MGVKRARGRGVRTMFTAGGLEIENEKLWVPVVIVCPEGHRQEGRIATSLRDERPAELPDALSEWCPECGGPCDHAVYPTLVPQNYSVA